MFVNVRKIVIRKRAPLLIVSNIAFRTCFEPISFTRWRCQQTSYKRTECVPSLFRSNRENCSSKCRSAKSVERAPGSQQELTFDGFDSPEQLNLVSLQILQNINTSHQHSKNYTGFLSNKESITKSVFSHTKHLQINNLHIFTTVFHFRHILFLRDLLIHLFFPFHMSDHHLAKGLSLSSVHDSGIHSLLILETRLLY